MLRYDFLNVVVSGVKLWTVTDPYMRRKEAESFALQQLDCFTLKEKNVTNDMFIASNIC